MSHATLLKQGKISQAEYDELDRLKFAAGAANLRRYHELEKLYAKRPTGLMNYSAFPSAFPREGRKRMMRRAFGTREDGRVYPKNYLEPVPPKVRKAVKVLEDYTRKGHLDKGVSLVDFLLKRPEAAKAVLGAAKIESETPTSKEVFRAKVNLENFSNPDFVKRGGWSPEQVEQTLRQSRDIIARGGGHAGLTKEEEDEEELNPNVLGGYETSSGHVRRHPKR